MNSTNQLFDQIPALRTKIELDTKQKKITASGHFFIATKEISARIDISVKIDLEHNTYLVTCETHPMPTQRIAD